jgi:peptidoglycan hydrolase-like protein with peptidoglycan-binding domain
MRNSKHSRLVFGILCVVLWPVVSAMPADWRIGQAQDRLRAIGLDPGPLDGVLGPRTSEALRRFQSSVGLPVTGTLDEATRQALLQTERLPERLEGKPPVTPKVPPSRERPPERGAAKPEPWLKAPPGGGYQKMGSLYQLPEFFSGLGMLYVQPETLPVGPYLAYDRQGSLVSTVYMIPLRDLRAGKAFNTMVVPHARVDHVDIYYNNGHPGVPDPHYHVVLWHIPPEQAAALE